ncbi:hypothetical protein EOA27_34250 [Mesorhizobium sp. M2A.F.Ca.ET.037.01.1.1]|uniref:hypothetical protein n=1 Tax=unclassified Mesorhizobium TaxID=325217 RepID=UPI000F75334E|nr:MULTISPECIES: hypothetical protein [unclassified Mesorhizobium]RUX98982.1 hypothetical protein EOA25_26810 [Mesorhizobium sp. M2A.F.Ca.ET.040.01.1.1]RVC57525.1 hypothetical protein EN759_35705 [Mesorhizobium sp. M00.F.Ca.ET.038.03.1.1]RVC71555.1 hypothetical protein EN766_26510 [Mesorhizobium sp. M2A.F.Ca.ET.046.02.1.1]AZO39048.1 hypothetical protein EJ072_34755 [Mesorhizobium sp. M2A.F.Ca.ET.046.03.2.1]RUX00592.1 hypothetical protein EOA27_34250 [Mesorhizobium sp. M2A.F.Ca.ET.037.01.1.1]
MSSTLSTALVILQPQRLPPPARPAASIDSVAGPAASPVMQPAVSASKFSLDGLNITATKVRLMQQAGKEFGVDQTDYESVSSYGSAIKSAVEALKRQSPSAVAKIERQLGLDQLGVSLDALVNAIVRPQGGDNDRLDAALKRHASGEGDQPDELGLYSL